MIYYSIWPHCNCRKNHGPKWSTRVSSIFEARSISCDRMRLTFVSIEVLHSKRGNCDSNGLWSLIQMTAILSLYLCLSVVSRQITYINFQIEKAPCMESTSYTGTAQHWASPLSTTLRCVRCTPNVDLSTYSRSVQWTMVCQSNMFMPVGDKHADCTWIGLDLWPHESVTNAQAIQQPSVRIYLTLFHTYSFHYFQFIKIHKFKCIYCYSNRTPSESIIISEQSNWGSG